MMRIYLLALLSVCAGVAIAQPVLPERLVLREVEPAHEFATTTASPVFQTRITRASIRDHLREYRVRVRNDGIAIQKRFTVGR